MKARSVIHISIIGLLFIVLIQLGGMIYEIGRAHV